VDVQIGPRVLYLCTICEWSASCSGCFTSGERAPRYQLDKRLGGYQNRSARRGEKFRPYRDSKSEPSAVQPVASLLPEIEFFRKHNGRHYVGGNICVAVATGMNVVVFMGVKTVISGLVYSGASVVWPLGCSLITCGKLGWRSKPTAIFHEQPHAELFVNNWYKFKSYPCNSPWRPIGLWDVEAATLSRQSTHRWR
jgi:hypothetical protein